MKILKKQLSEDSGTDIEEEVIIEEWLNGFIEIRVRTIGIEGKYAKQSILLRPRSFNALLKLMRQFKKTGTKIIKSQLSKDSEAVIEEWEMGTIEILARRHDFENEASHHQRILLTERESFENLLEAMKEFKKIKEV